MRVDLVPVAPCRVRLPDLDELPAQRLAVGAEHTPGHGDPLAEWLAGVLTRQVGVGLAERRLSPYTGPVNSESDAGRSTSGSFGARRRVPT